MPEPQAENTARKPDALLIPKALFAEIEGVERAQKINKVFGPILGCARIDIGHREMDPHQQYLRPFRDRNTLQFDGTSPLKGQSRYDWFIARQDNDGNYAPVSPVLGLEGDAKEVRFGYLVDEAELTRKARAATLDPEYERALEAARRSPDSMARLARRGLLPGETARDTVKPNPTRPESADAPAKPKR